MAYPYLALTLLLTLAALLSACLAPVRLRTTVLLSRFTRSLALHL